MKQPQAVTANERREKNAATGITRERNEREILAAAEKIFAVHGYRGASVQAIAEAAGLPKSNVLYYMGSKRALYVRLLERMMTRWNVLLEDISVEDDPAVVLE
ncbi:MAG: TetR/AcrR family transcriptional regulator, partial [Halomonas sp.]